MHNNFLIKIIAAPITVLVIHIIATISGAYEQIFWLDKPIHFLGGVAIALSTYYTIAYFTENKKLQINWVWLRILAISSVVALSVVSWEFLEFYLDSISSGTMQPSIRDTMTDMLMGMAGGMITAFIISWRKK
jgi:hypothetical protein